MLYAQIDKNNKKMIGEPQLLPYSFATKEGVLINSFNKLSNATLCEFGWLPCESEIIPSYHTHALNPVADVGDTAFTYRVYPLTEETVKANALDEIKEAADKRIKTLGFTEIVPAMLFLLGLVSGQPTAEQETMRLEINKTKQAETNGLAAVDAAKTVEEIETARKNASTAMEAI
jgi:hypothetical protein